jgi:hypothetical protein
LLFLVKVADILVKINHIFIFLCLCTMCKKNASLSDGGADPQAPSLRGADGSDGSAGDETDPETATAPQLLTGVYLHCSNSQRPDSEAGEIRCLVADGSLQKRLTPDASWQWSSDHPEVQLQKIDAVADNLWQSSFIYSSLKALSAARISLARSGQSVLSAPIRQTIATPFPQKEPLANRMWRDIDVTKTIRDYPYCTDPNADSDPKNKGTGWGWQPELGGPNGGSCKMS